MPLVRFGVVDANILTGMGLQNLLEDIIPVAEVTLLRTIEQVKAAEDEGYAHFFVSSRIYFEHAQYFRDLPTRSIVLVNGDMSIHGVQTLNVCQSMNHLVRDLLQLQKMQHGPHGKMPIPAHFTHPHVQGETTLQAHPHAAGHPHAQDFPPALGHPHAASHPHTQGHSAPSSPLLSAREVEVAVLLCQGYINKEIAERLHISLATVISHRKNIMEKLHARSLADIIVYVVMNGLLDASEL